MLNKNEAERILRAAAGQSQPEAGDGLFWSGDQGWLFTPGLYFGAKIIATQGEPSVSFPLTTTPKLIGGVDDIFDSVVFERILRAVWRTDTATGTIQIPNGEFIVPDKVTGFVQVTFKAAYQATGNRDINFALAVRDPETGGVTVSPLERFTSKDEEFSFTCTFELPGPGILGSYMWLPGTPNITISLENTILTLNFLGR